MALENQDNLQKYYEYLKGAKADVPPTLDSFQKTLSNEDDAKKYYDYLKTNKFDAPDTYESFSNTLGLKKKDATDYGLPTSEAFGGVLSKAKKPDEVQTKPVDVETKIGDLLKNSKEPKNPFLQPADETSVDNQLRPLQKAPKLGEYLNERGVTPSQVGLPDDTNLDRDLRDGEQAGFDSLLKTKGITQPPKTSYFWGSGKEVHKVVSSVMRDVGDAFKTLKNTVGLENVGPLQDVAKGISGLVDKSNIFYDIADFVDKRGKDIPDMPGTEVGKLLSSGIGLAPLFIEMAGSPEFKIGSAFGKEINASRFLTQMAGKGFVNNYAAQIDKGGTPMEAVTEGLKGAGENALMATVFTKLGYGSSKLGEAVTKATGSGVAGGATSLISNSTGFAGYSLAEMIAKGEPIDGDKLRSSAELGALMTVPEFARFAMGRATGNYLMSSPGAEDAASKLTLSVPELRQKAQDIREKAKDEPDLQKRATQEMIANTLDGLGDINVIANEVRKNPTAFTDALEQSDLTPEQQKIFKDKIKATEIKWLSTPEITKINNDIESLKKSVKEWEDEKAVPEATRNAKIDELNGQIKDKTSQIKDIINSKAEEDKKQDEQDIAKGKEIYQGLSAQERSGVQFAEALPDIMNKAFEQQKPFKEAFLKRKGITEEEFNKLSQSEKDKFQEEWGKSPELKELLAQKAEPPKKEEPKPEKTPYVEVTPENISEIEKNHLALLDKEKATPEKIALDKENIEYAKKYINGKTEGKDGNGETSELPETFGRISEIKPEGEGGDGRPLQEVYDGRRSGNQSPKVSPEEQVSNQLAPNGEKSNLSSEDHIFVRTPEFKARFGDWQKGEGSLVLDANGEPLKVYSGQSKLHVEGVEPDRSGAKKIHFTGDKGLAAQYARFREKQPVVYKGFINVTDPAEINRWHDNQQEFLITEKEQFIPRGIEDATDIFRPEKGNAEKPKNTFKEPTEEEKTIINTDKLVGLRNDYNDKPNSYKVQKGKIFRQIQKLAKEGDYQVKIVGQKVSITREGEEIKESVQRTPQAQIEGQKLLNEYPEEFQNYVSKVLQANPDLIGTIQGLSSAQRKQAARDIKNGKKSVASLQALKQLELMHKQGGGVHFFDDTSQSYQSITPDELQEEVAAINRPELDNYAPDEYEKAFSDGKLNKDEYERLSNWDKANEEQQGVNEENDITNQAGNDQRGASEGKGTQEKPSSKLWDKGGKDTPESVKNRFGIADQEFTPEDVDNIPRTFLWRQNGKDVYAVDDNYMKTHFYSNWTEGGNPAVYPEFTPKGDVHVGNNIDEEVRMYPVAHEIWEDYKVDKKGLKYSSPQGSAHEQSNNMEIPLRRFEEETLKPKGGEVLSINVTDEGFNFKYKETADGPEKEATMFPDGTMKDGKHGNDLGSETETKPNEKPNEPNTKVSKGEADNVSGGTEGDKKPVAPEGEEKPTTTEPKPEEVKKPEGVEYKGKYYKTLDDVFDDENLTRKEQQDLREAVNKYEEDQIKQRIAKNLEDLADNLGAIKKFEGGERETIIKNLMDLLENLADLTKLKGEQLLAKLKEYLKEDKKDIPDDVINEAFDRHNRKDPEYKLVEALKTIPTKKVSMKERLQLIKDKVAGMSAGTFKDSFDSKLANLKENVKAVWKAYSGMPDVTDYKKALGDWSLAKQLNDKALMDFVKIAEKKIPLASRREAIVNYIEANGDIDILKKREEASKPKFKQGYKDAQKLSLDEIKVAESMKDYFDSMMKNGFDAGILKSMVENYVTHFGVRPDDPKVTKVIGGLDNGKLNTTFKYAKGRIFDTFFALEQQGFRADKDFKDIIPAYSKGFNRTIYSRAFIKNLTEGTAKDGRPIIANAGMGSMTEDDNIAKAALVNPYAKPEEVGDYKYVNHPAFRDWYWATKTPDGTNVFAKGELVVHPDYANDLTNILGKSDLMKSVPFREIAKGVNVTKQTIFMLSPFFHYIQEGFHGLGHTVNPIWGMSEFDPKNDIHRKLIKGGLQLYDFHAKSNFAEGLASLNIASKIPLIKDTILPLQEYLFNEYIPRLKLTTAEHMVKRNLKRYSTPWKVFGKELRKAYSVERIYQLSADQSNKAYGNLDYAAMGRNPTVQHLFRTIALAPDFLEARTRFVGQALTPKGAEQRRALLILGGTLFVASRIMNKLFDDDYHWDRPFSFIYKKNEYTLRSVPEDMFELFNDPRRFTYNRLSPLFRSGVVEGLTRRDYQGIPESTSDWLKSIVTSPMPTQITKMLPEAWGKSESDNKLWDNFINTIGLRERHYFTPLEKNIRNTYYDRYPRGKQSENQQNKMQVRRDIYKITEQSDGKPLSKENKDKMTDLINQNVKDGKITIFQGQDLLDNIGADTKDINVIMYNRLPEDDKADLYNKMSDEEKKIYPTPKSIYFVGQLQKEHKDVYDKLIEYGGFKDINRITSIKSEGKKVELSEEDVKRFNEIAVNRFGENVKKRIGLDKDTWKSSQQKQDTENPDITVLQARLKKEWDQAVLQTKGDFKPTKK